MRLIKNKKGSPILSAMIVLAAFMALTWALVVLVGKDMDRGIGAKQLNMLDTYQEGTEILFYIEQAAKYGAEQSLFDLAYIGGTSGCGATSEGYMLWNNKEGICFPTEDGIIAQLNWRVNSYLEPYLKKIIGDSGDEALDYELELVQNDKLEISGLPTHVIDLIIPKTYQDVLLLNDASQEADVRLGNEVEDGEYVDIMVQEAKIPSDAIGIYTIFPSFMVEIDYNIKEYNDIIEDTKLFLEEVEECKKKIIPPDHENYSLDQDEPESIDECVIRKRPNTWIPISSEDNNYNYNVPGKETINGILVNYRLALYFGDIEYELEKVEYPSVEFVKPTPQYPFLSTGDNFGEGAIISENSVLFNPETYGGSNLFIALSAITNEFSKRGVTMTPQLLSSITVTLIKEVGAFGFLPVEEWGDYCMVGGYGGGCDYKGRGYIQITHQSNYEKYCGADCLVSHKNECKCNNVDICLNQNCPPAKALQPEVAARIFAEYYIGRGLQNYANQGSYWDVGYRINGGKSYADDFQVKAEKLTSILRSRSQDTSNLITYLNNPSVV